MILSRRRSGTSGPPPPGRRTQPLRPPTARRRRRAGRAGPAGPASRPVVPASRAPGDSAARKHRATEPEHRTSRHRTAGAGRCRAAQQRGAAAVTLTIGVDVGGTKVAGGVVDDTGTVLVQTRRDTPADDVGKTRDVIIEVVTELAAGHAVEAVGIGAAGWIDATRSTVLFAPNLAWRDEPLRDVRQQGHRPAGDRGERRERGRLGRVPLRRGPRRRRLDGHVHHRHRRRRRHRARRRAGPRRATASPPSWATC